MMDITLLDGSIGQELVKRAGERPTPLWSTQVMIDHPEMVQEVHEAYFQAGATIATTNTYCVLRDRLALAGIEDRVAELSEKAVQMALTARKAHGAGRVAGSVGPINASYRPDLCPTPDEAVALYAEPLSLISEHVDLLVLETVSSLQQAEGALRAVAGYARPVWLALSVDDDDGNRLRSGEPVSAVADLVDRHQPEAVLVNCSRPEAVGAALDVIKGFGAPFGAYANGFTCISDGFLKHAPTADALQSRSDLGPEAYADFAMGWIAQGATIVGGCCEVGPAHISKIAHRLRAAGHRIV